MLWFKSERLKNLILLCQFLTSKYIEKGNLKSFYIPVIQTQQYHKCFIFKHDLVNVNKLLLFIEK